MRGEASRSVLITGCSTGIGRATAIRLARSGLRVYATARRLEAIEALAGEGCHLLPLDVCDPASMEDAVARVEAEHGGVDVLVNNAGFGLTGAVETLSLDEVRRQFETNLFGPLWLTQRVLPGMRRARAGRIVNVSSVAGRITLPGGGAYHASKHALEALTDALRMEVRGFGVDVILVEPGAIRSAWVDTAVRSQAASGDPGDPYADFHGHVSRRLRGAHEGLLRLAAGPPEAVARVIERAITARRPGVRYVVPRVSRLFIASARWLPDRLWDAMMRRAYGAPGAARTR